MWEARYRRMDWTKISAMGRDWAKSRVRPKQWVGWQLVLEVGYG